MAQSAPIKTLFLLPTVLILGLGIRAACAETRANDERASTHTLPSPAISDPASSESWQRLESFLAKNPPPSTTGPTSTEKLLPLTPTLLKEPITDKEQQAQDRRRRILGDKAAVVIRYAPLPGDIVLSPEAAAALEAKKAASETEEATLTTNRNKAFERKLTTIQKDRQLLEAIKDAITSLDSSPKASPNKRDLDSDSTGHEPKRE